MASANTAALKAIQSQLQELLHDPPPGVNAGPVDDEDLYLWSGVVTGPPGSPYEGGVFFLDIRFPESYPFDPPRVRFSTPIYHPNVNEGGGICLSVLFKECAWGGGWSPALSISSVLLSIVALLSEPATDHSLRPELAKQYDDDRAAFDKAARSFTKQHAM